jgi:DNA-binding PadR family transcriptional regulator
MDPKAGHPLDRSALKPSDFYVLSALSRGDRHGYALVVEIEDQSEGRIVLAPGSLYAILRRLRGWGWIDEIEPSAEGESGGPPRRLYRLASDGKRALRAEVERMRRAVDEFDRTQDRLEDPLPDAGAP